MEQEGKRLNKYIADDGYCSRREADRLIEKGKVYIRRHSRKDEPEKEAVKAGLGDRVFSGDTVIIDGMELQKKEPRRVYYMLHKPKGIICTADKRVPGNVIDYVHLPVRVTYAGRLDKDSEGLLILTNDGDLADSMMRASHAQEKEYVCTVDKAVTEEFLKHMAGGVKIHLDDDYSLKKSGGKGIYVTTRPCKVRRLGENMFSLVLTQGYNRQIRRMCRALGYSVVSLKRTRVLNLRLGDLKTGEAREVTQSEVRALYDALRKNI
jgi:23S rRNA pseudouridine2604 synthase